jgi:MFS family permease
MAVSADERAPVVRRMTVLLAGSQIALMGAVGAFAAFGPIAGPELTGRAGETGTLFGLYYVGAAVGALSAGRVMDRFGRRPGLAGGYVLIAAAGAISSAAMVGGSVLWLRLSYVLVGVGVGAALLGRAAVADLYPPERRGRAVGILVMMGTIGAVAGPPLSGAVHSLAGAAGVGEPLAAPWLLASALALVALGLVVAIRPDPRDLAIRPAVVRPGRPPREILTGSSALPAAVTIAVAQSVMVTLMSVIPALLHQRGSGELTVTLVVSLHLGAMFGFSSVLGSLLDTWGRRAGLMAGLAMLATGVLLSLAGGGPIPGGSGLVLIGVGWSAAYLGSTALISDLTAPEERGSTLGAADLAAALAAAAGVFGGGILLEATSFRVLAVVALIFLAVPLALLVGGTGAARKETRGAPV